MKKVLRAIGNTVSTLNKLREASRYKMPFYAVAAGWETGVFQTWSACEQKVKGFSKPVFKKFASLNEAEEFMKAHKTDKSNSFDPKTSAIALGSKVPALFPKAKVEPKDEKAPERDENWPEDADFEEGDNDLLLKALEEVEGIPGNPRKRKLSAVRDLATTSGISPMFKRCLHDSSVSEPIGLKRIGNFEFPIDSEGYVIVYTDGSCINNGQAGAVAGFGVYFSEGHSLNTAQPVCGRVTNNAGEIQAAIHAIQIAKDFGIRKLCLSTDSQFLINAVTMWMKGWKSKGWKLKTGGKVKNVDDFKVLDKLLDGTIDIKWNYVKGHKGIEGNEKADQLARKGAEMYRLKMLNKKT